MKYVVHQIPEIIDHNAIALQYLYTTKFIFMIQQITPLRNNEDTLFDRDMLHRSNFVDTNR